MGEQRNSLFYDANYLRRTPGAKGDLSRNLLWDTIRKKIPDDIGIVDLGCGIGSLSGNRENYIGYDFSQIAIGKAKKKYPHSEFVCDNLFHLRWPRSSWFFYILCEVLEHLDEDLRILRAIPVGSRLVLSVPDRDDPTHVRYFPMLAQARDRYDKLLEGKWTQCKCWWIFNGKRI